MSIYATGELEVFNHHFLDPLPILSIYSLSCTTKGYHELISACASCPQPDITLEGKSFTIMLEPANRNVRGILRQKLKVEALTINPGLLWGFDKPRAMVLFNKENNYPAIGPNSLNESLQQCSRRPDPVQFTLFVLTHPNILKIPSDVLGWVLQVATKPRFVRLILSLPQAEDFSAQHLNYCLAHICDERSLKLIFSHPKSKEIKASGSNSLCDALNHHATLGNEPCAKRILCHRNIFKSSSSDILNLEVALETAKRFGHPNIEEQIQTVLDDIKTLRDLKLLLEAPNPEQNLQKIGTTFTLLSARVQHLLYKALCEAHGRQSDDVDRDGMFHLVKKPSSLLPIITNLLG